MQQSIQSSRYDQPNNMFNGLTLAQDDDGKISWQGRQKSPLVQADLNDAHDSKSAAGTRRTKKKKKVKRAKNDAS